MGDGKGDAMGLKRSPDRVAMSTGSTRGIGGAIAKGDPRAQDSMDLSPGEFSRIIDINLKGTFYGSSKRAAHVTSKHALVGRANALADEWASPGIRVLGITPGYIETDCALRDTRTRDAYSVHDIETRTPMGRYGTTEEGVPVVAYMGSHGASYVTGSTVAVDGARVARGGWYPTPGES